MGTTALKASRNGGTATAARGMKIARIGGTVRLTISPKVAFDLGALQAGLKGLAGRLGCEQCATGCDILHILTEREFVLRDDATVSRDVFPSGRMLPQDPVPIKTVTVLIPDRVNNNIDLLNKAIDSALTKLGCAPCSSGFDILFQRYMDTIAINERAEVSAF